MLDAFKLTAVLISGALWSAWLVLVLRKKNVHPLRDALEGFGRLGWMKKVGVLFIVTQLTMFGGAKHGGTNDVDDVTSTNEVEIVDGGDTNGVGGIVLNAPQPMFNGAAFLGGCGPLGTTAPTAVDPDVVRGYRLASVSTNDEISYAMPDGATVRGTWHLTGAYEDVQKIGLGVLEGLEGLGGLEGTSFRFPIGNHLCTSLWAYTWGKVRPQLRNASNEIVAVGAPMSAIPGVSRFWTAATSNDSYLLTWENFAEGRLPAPRGEDSAGTVNAQLEFFRNGDFVARSNEVESVYRRVNPDDWDDDGLPNEDDPEPHYRAEGETFFGPRQDLSVIAHSNNYYWVDLVVSNANAKVKFSSELTSNLQDPVFIARPGETNRIVLLLGKPYVVECPQPFSLVAFSHEDIVVEAFGEKRMSISRPVQCIPVGAQVSAPRPAGLLRSGGGGGISPSFVPEPEGGTVSWNGNYCCVEILSSGLPLFNCDGTCGCGGCTTGVISDTYEGVTLTFDAWHCGCPGSHDDPPPGEDDPEDAPQGPSVSATFSHDAIIFEDEYENAPGEFVPRRSTDVEAEFYVYGGTNGGSYAFTLTDGGRLRRLGGSYVPRTGTVSAGEDFHIKVRYDAVSASGSEGDIKAKVEFTENGSGRKISKEAALTAVKVELTVEANAPGNECEHRHVLGVGERFSMDAVPGVGVQVVPQGNGFQSDQLILVAPLVASVNPLKVLANGVEYEPNISVIEPTVVEACQVDVITFGMPYLCAGGIGLTMKFRILPLSVSFSGIDVQEVPSSMGYQTGYFANPYFANEWSHTVQNGAGRWSEVDYYNVTELTDTAAITYSLPRVGSNGVLSNDITATWAYGRNEWSVPFGWRGKTPSSSELVKGFAAGETQVFTIDPQGTVQVQKLHQTAERDIFNHVYLNGELK